MSSIVGARVYPLSGARCIETLNPKLIEFDRLTGGLTGDRSFVCYDPENMNRLSSKPNQLPWLAMMQPGFVDAADGPAVSLQLFEEDGFTAIDSSILLSMHNGGEAVKITEFGQDVSLIDMGDKVAEEFSGFLSDASGKMQNVRVGRRDPGMDDLTVEQRANKALHIVSLVTVEHISETTGLDTAVVADRLRANLVVDESGEHDRKPNEEVAWNYLTFKDSRVKITGPTKRCPVPSMDTKTGKGMGDIAKMYRDAQFVLPRRKGPHIGVYGFSYTIHGDNPLKENNNFTVS